MEAGHLTDVIQSRSMPMPSHYSYTGYIYSLCVWRRLVGIFGNELLKVNPPPFLGSHLVSIHCYGEYNVKEILRVNILQLISPHDFEYYTKTPSWIDPVSVWIYRASVDKWTLHLSSCLWVSIKTVLPDHLIGQMPLNLIVTLFLCLVYADFLSVKSCKFVPVLF